MSVNYTLRLGQPAPTHYNQCCSRRLKLRRKVFVDYLFSQTKTKWKLNENYPMMTKTKTKYTDNFVNT